MTKTLLRVPFRLDRLPVSMKRPFLPRRQRPLNLNHPTGITTINCRNRLAGIAWSHCLGKVGLGLCMRPWMISCAAMLLSKSRLVR